MPRALTVIGSVIAPTTLLTALLLYFGRLHAQGLFRHLRVPLTILDLTPQEYLIRSADGLFVPMTVAAAVVAVVCWGHHLAVGAVPEPTRVLLARGLAPLALLAGLVLVGFAAAGMLAADDLIPAFPEAGGLGLAIGVPLLAYAVRLLRFLAATRWPALRSRSSGGVVAEWTAVFVLVGVGLFWAVTSYAIGVGTFRGQQIARELASTADVVLYSEKSLRLTQPGVREVPCADAEAAYRFRYEGLKFVMRSGEQYLLLPAQWTRESGSALVVPRSGSLRVEFTAPGSVAPAASC